MASLSTCYLSALPWMAFLVYLVKSCLPPLCSLVTSSLAFHDPFKLSCVALEPHLHPVASTPASAPHVVTTPYDCVAALSSKLASSDQQIAAPTTDHASDADNAACDNNGLTSPLDVGTLTGQSSPVLFQFLQNHKFGLWRNKAVLFC